MVFGGLILIAFFVMIVLLGEGNGKPPARLCDKERWQQMMRAREVKQVEVVGGKDTGIGRHQALPHTVAG